MMELFIQIRDGQPFEHPIVESNFREAFPNIDTENLPPEFARFQRTPRPKVSVDETTDAPIYGWDDGIVKEFWTIRPMTDEEKAVKLAAENARLEWLRANPPHPNWIWNEERLKWDVPPLPTTGGPWRFDGITNDWIIATEAPFPSWTLREDGLRYIAPTPMPVDNNRYRWDETTISWKQLNV
jgi:hypothetical protein